MRYRPLSNDWVMIPQPLCRASKGQYSKISVEFSHWSRKSSEVAQCYRLTWVKKHVLTSNNPATISSWNITSSITILNKIPRKSTENNNRDLSVLLTGFGTGLARGPLKTNGMPHGLTKQPQPAKNIFQSRCSRFEQTVCPTRVFVKSINSLPVGLWGQTQLVWGTFHLVHLVTN